MAGGMCGGGGHVWGMCGRGACMAGGVHGRGHAWQGACMAGWCVVVGGMHGRGHAHAWWGACMAGGVCIRGVRPLQQTVRILLEYFFVDVRQFHYVL